MEKTILLPGNDNDKQEISLQVLDFTQNTMLIITLRNQLLNCIGNVETPGFIDSMWAMYRNYNGSLTGSGSGSTTGVSGTGQGQTTGQIQVTTTANDSENQVSVGYKEIVGLWFQCFVSVMMASVLFYLR